MSEPSLLTIELGTRCNNRCAFCPQHFLRIQPFHTRELTTRQVVDRLRSGRKRRFDRVAFTGGEPTVRSDLPQLIQAAREMGYSEIGMTTNGRMLGAFDLATELVAAGLNRVSFSLHSDQTALHDRLSGVSGAQDQLLQGMQALRTAAQRAGAQLGIHSVSLLLPETVDHVEQTVAMAARMGATIHLLQPFITSRANLHVAHRYVVAPAALADAVTRAGRTALGTGTRVKPYNVPYCWLPGLDGIEVQEYTLATHKRHQNEAQEEQAVSQAQFHRIDRCSTCATPCPGIRVEHYPRSQMVREILEDLECYRNPTVALPGTDLLGPEPLSDLLTALTDQGRTVNPVVGGYHWCTPDELTGVFSGRVGEVVLLLRSAWEDPEGLEPDPGNEQQLLDLAQRLKSRGTSTRLFLSALDLPELALPMAAVADRFDAITVAVPRIWRGVGANGNVARHLAPKHARVLGCADNLARHVPVELATFDNVRILGQELAMVQKSYAAVLPSTDWSGRLVRHRFTTQAYNFVMWGNPFWLY